MNSALYIVGVGASAGGLEPLEQFFSEVPPGTGLAFVVVQHLSPDFKSMMDQLLARRTSLPVMVVEDGVEVAGDHIYLIPPKKEMIVSGGKLLLRDKATDHELTLPIDVFMRSLARDCGSRAVAVILSGGGSDGSRGIRDVHEAGGLVVCQDEESAAFDGMPKSARDTGVVDYVLPPREMPQRIIEHVRRLEQGEPSPAAASSPAKGLNAIFHLLQGAYGIDFSHYKPTTVLRRIERRLELASIADFDAYVGRLSSERAELDALYRDLLIGVTRFFRDEEAFDVIARDVIPPLLESATGEEIRVWVPGCATGEEAYSLAILFHEHMSKARDKRRLKVFATDVHHASLDFASRGLYDEASCARVSPGRLERYFERQGPALSVSNELRQLIVFARQNVIKDAPFTRVDLVSCRNMLIYLQPQAQKRALALFHFALRTGGFLFLGPSESAGELDGDLETVNKHWRVHRKDREHARAPEAQAHALTARTPSLAGARRGPTAQQLSQTISLYEALLDEHMPPSLLVNERQELVHTFNGGGRWIGLRDGRTSLDVLDLVGPQLRVALAGALRRTIADKTALSYEGVRLRLDDSEEAYRISVKPIFAKSAPVPHVLIGVEPINAGRPASLKVKELSIGEVSHEQLAAMETELRFAKENLQTTIEELETSNEELQSTNEELVAANEELQSTNEELQSVNEELFTVNAEYQKKITQLTELTNDIDNLLLSTDVGTIFLDAQLRIRKFTPKIASAFNLLPQDVGRPLSAFTNNLNYAAIMSDVEAVLKTEKPVERELTDDGGNWFFLRVLPYRAVGGPQGVVLTFIDINGLKEAENALFRERHLFDSLMESVPDAIYFKDAKGRFVRVNAAAATRLGIKNPAHAVGGRATDFVPHDVAWPLDQPDIRILNGEMQPYCLEEHRVLGGDNRWFMTTRQPLRDKCGDVVGMCAVVRDVTEQKQAEDEIRVAVTRRDEFLAMLSHELRNPLAAIVTASELLLEREVDGQGRRVIEVLARQTHQMARLLDDLLEATRVTHNKIELNRRILDLRKIVDDAVEPLASTLRTKRLTLHKDLDERPVVVDGDPARLQQIVVNLMGNAAKYTPAGGNAWLRVAREAGEAVITVRDDGVGIEPAMLGSIFELFVQARPTLARAEGGLGVGLALVRALVEMHGGKVAASSGGTGQGSEFTVRLPLSSGATADPAPPTQAPSVLPPTLTIAVVDDNRDNCEMLSLVLKKLGWQVHCAYDGVAGLELIERTKPDVALVDIGLPELDGYALAQQLRAKSDRASALLIALTGYGRPSDREAAIAAGFDEHLVKPIQPDELKRVLSRHLGNRDGRADGVN